MSNAHENDGKFSSTHGADASRRAIDDARARAKHEKAERERPKLVVPDPTTAVGIALVRAALEKARSDGRTS